MHDTHQKLNSLYVKITKYTCFPASFHLPRYFIVITAIITTTLASIIYAVNHSIYQFPGNTYFPPGMLSVGIILVLILLGTYLLFDKHHPYFQISRELIYFFLVVSVIAYATTAVQYTPFTPIDYQLILFDKALSINLQAIIAWTTNRPYLKTILAISYDSLPFQMSYLPLVLIFARKFIYLREYYTMLFLTALLGFSIYYFFPTMGPASFIDSPYFYKVQYKTGIKFLELHHYLIPSTNDGGMIAMPSFHVIWAWLCQSLSRCWPLLFCILLPINLLLTASCVLLGWHYFVDLLGSLIVLLIAYSIYFLSLNGNSNFRTNASYD